MTVFSRFVALLFFATTLLCHPVRGDEECAVAGECNNPNVETTTEESYNAEKEEDASCPSRPFVIKCAEKYLDINQNGLLESVELQSAIDALPWYSRGIVSILGSVDKIMKKCDVDGDGAISLDYDMKNNGDTCLASCFKRVAFKKAFFPDCTSESLQ